MHPVESWVFYSTMGIAGAWSEWGRGGAKHAAKQSCAACLLLLCLARLLVALCGAHPLVVLHCKFFNTVVAMVRSPWATWVVPFCQEPCNILRQVGHDGFGDPSTGGHGHWLHHHLVTCNYGEPYVPLDWLCGTWVATEGDHARLMTAQRSQSVKVQ